MSTSNLVVQVPATLISDPVLSPAAKLIWMILRLGDPPDSARTTVLERRSGLSRKTVSKAMAELVAAGRYPADPVTGTAERVRMPAGLLMDQRVGIRGRILYGHLQRVPGFRHPAGQFTYPCLSDLTGDDLKTVRRAVSALAAAGWLQVTQENQRRPLRFHLRDPWIDRGRAEAERAGRRLEEASFRGEALMREYLSLLVDSEDFEDNATPGFLVNPLTGERMQLDRFYPPGVAFEFNGPQHYGATERYSEADAAKQRCRDLIKTGICATRGIRLAVIHPEDLALERMREKIGSGLPLRDLNGHEQWIAFLESVSRRYRSAAKRKGPAAVI